MFNVGGGEMLGLLLIALIVLGPERLPKAMREVGRYVGQLRQMSNGFQDEIRRAIDPQDAPFRPGEESHPVPDVDEVRVIGSGDLPTESAEAPAETPAETPAEPSAEDRRRVDGHAPRLRAVADPDDGPAAEPGDRAAG